MEVLSNRWCAENRLSQCTHEQWPNRMTTETKKKKCNEIKQKGWRVNWYRMIGSTQSGLWNCHCCWQELICAALNPWACQTANLQIESKFIIAASTVNYRERQRRIKKRVRSQQHNIYEYFIDVNLHILRLSRNIFQPQFINFCSCSVCYHCSRGRGR